MQKHVVQTEICIRLHSRIYLITIDDRVTYRNIQYELRQLVVIVIIIISSTFVLSLLQKNKHIYNRIKSQVPCTFVIVINLTSNYEHQYSYKLSAYKAVGYALEVEVHIANKDNFVRKK